MNARHHSYVCHHVGGVALLLGLGGLFLRRRIASGAGAGQASAVQTPVIGEKV